MTCYFLQDQESEYFNTATFQKIIRYASDHLKRCQFKEQNGKNILIFKVVDRVKDALDLLREINS